MNSIKNKLMLNINNVCALLLMCVTHLGCTSHYRNQMDTGGEGSSSKEESMYDMSGDGDGHNVDLHEKIKKFLEKEDFEAGLPITNVEIVSVIEELGRSVDMFTIDSIDKEYIAFLNKYGSIDGGGFDISGPDIYTDDKVKCMLSIQRGFENRCKMNQVKSSQVKSCWLIAGIDQGDEYYINLSRANKNYVYSMSPDGKSKLFAKDFLEFLDKFLEVYDRKDAEKSYEKDLYEKEEDVESEEFNRMYEK